jgi:geranylgeranyl diphosphate synthase, type I
LHVSALVHDDVMDSSDRRRGAPSAHRQFEALHAGSGWVGDRQTFGHAGAILLGDLLLMWSSQMIQRSGLARDALERALPVVEAMRTEVTCGQYLDVVAQVQPLHAGPGEGAEIGIALDEASRVVEYKSARYTVRRPCQTGAAMACASAELQEALAAYGSPLGRAFQFRDDLLGVFGDPDRTGKPAGDDLREGKRTVLIAHALASADMAGRELLVRRLGDSALDDAGVRELQHVITASGAREEVEAMIAAGHRQALRALADADLTPAGRTALTALAELAVDRED